MILYKILNTKEYSSCFCTEDGVLIAAIQKSNNSFLVKEEFKHLSEMLKMNLLEDAIETITLKIKK